MSNKNAPVTIGNESALDKRDHTARQDLFPETLTPIERAFGSIYGRGADESPRAAPIVSGQCAQVLELIREHQPFLSFRGTADFAIPEFAARVHDLRALGFNVRTRIEPKVIFRGRERRNAAFYSLGTPEWPAPGFDAGA